MKTLHTLHNQGPSEEAVVTSIAWKWLLAHECWHLHSTSKSGWRIEWANEKYEHTIIFVTSNNEKPTIQFLNSEKLRIGGSRNLLDSLKILLHRWTRNLQVQRRTWPYHCDPCGKPWKTTVKLTIFRHVEKLTPRENFKDHVSAPCFWRSHGSTCILKNGQKI